RRVDRTRAGAADRLHSRTPLWPPAPAPAPHRPAHGVRPDLPAQRVRLRIPCAHGMPRTVTRTTRGRRPSVGPQLFLRRPPARQSPEVPAEAVAAWQLG